MKKLKKIWRKIIAAWNFFTNNMAVITLCMAIVVIIVLYIFRPETNFQEWTNVLMAIGTFCVAVAAVFPVRSKERISGIYTVVKGKDSKVTLHMRIYNIGQTTVSLGMGIFGQEERHIQIGIIEEKGTEEYNQESIWVSNNISSLVPGTVINHTYELQDHSFILKKINVRIWTNNGTHIRLKEDKKAAEWFVK